MFVCFFFFIIEQKLNFIKVLILIETKHYLSVSIALYYHFLWKLRGSKIFSEYFSYTAGCRINIYHDKPLLFFDTFFFLCSIKCVTRWYDGLSDRFKNAAIKSHGIANSSGTIALRIKKFFTACDVLRRRKSMSNDPEKGDVPMPRHGK